MFLRSAIIAVVSLSGVAHATAAEIVVQPRGTVSATVVRLSDVCVIEGRDAATLANLELGPAPQAGGRKVWRAREIQDRLTLLGVDLAAHRFGGANQSVLTAADVAQAVPKANTAQRTAVDKALTVVVEQVLAQSEGGRMLKAQPRPSDEQYAQLPTGAQLLRVISPIVPRVGTQTVHVETLGRDPRRAAIEIELVEAPLSVAVVRNVPRGAIITPADVELRPRDEKVVRASFDSLEQVVGREAVQGLIPGQTIDAKTIRNQIVVRKGDVIDVAVHSGGIKVGTKGRARGDGGVGDLVQIELLHNKQALLARVSGLQTVQVLGGADR